MIFKIILYLMILLIISLIPYRENYYTFFTPFYNKNIKILNTNKKDYTYKELRIGSLKNYNKFIIYFSKRILEFTDILKIKIINKKDVNTLVNNLNNYNLDLGIIPRPILYNYFNKYKNIRFVTNLNSSTFYMIYNSHNLKFTENNINIKNLPKNINIGVDNNYTINYTLTKDIIKNIFGKDVFNIIKDYSLEILINKLSDNKDKINVVTFIDSNPSEILNKILNNDIKNKIKIMSIKKKDMYFKETQTIYLQDFIKFKKYSQLNLYNTYETIYFFNVLIANNNLSEKTIYKILKFLNRENIDKYLIGNNIRDIYFNREPNVIDSHKGVDQFYKDNIFNLK